MKTLATILAVLFLFCGSAAALEACNRYDDNVDECYENYYRSLELQLLRPPGVQGH